MIVSLNKKVNKGFEKKMMEGDKKQKRIFLKKKNNFIKEHFLVK